MGKEELGCELGITAVLHTWGQKLDEHYHLHCIVTGGGLALDKSRWVRGKSQRYLFDVEKLSGIYRAGLLGGLRKLYRQGELTLVGPAAQVDVEAVIEAAWAKKWEVFAKAFDKPEAVVGGKGKKKKLTLPVLEFIRRFLQHILPTGFVRIRYFGLHHSSARKEKLPRSRELLGLERRLPAVKEISLLEWLEEILGQEAGQCPHCGAEGSLIERACFAQLPWLVDLILSLFGQPTTAGVSR